MTYSVWVIDDTKDLPPTRVAPTTAALTDGD
jgi:hypothetical protein